METGGSRAAASTAGCKFLTGGSKAEVIIGGSKAEVAIDEQDTSKGAKTWLQSESLL